MIGLPIRAYSSDSDSPLLEAEESDDAHAFTIERIEDDWFVTLDHPMTKDHYVSFVDYVTPDGICMKSSTPSGWSSRAFALRAAAGCTSTATSKASLSGAPRATGRRTIS